MSKSTFITDNKIDPANDAKQGIYKPSSFSDVGFEFLDNLGGVATDVFGSFGSGLVNKYFGKSSGGNANLVDGSLNEDQTAVLGDAKINQSEKTSPMDFIKKNWVYLAGGAAVLGAVVFIAKK